MEQKSEEILTHENRKKGIKKKIISILFGLAAAVFLLSAFVYNDKADDFSDIITICPRENGFSQDMLEALKQDETNTDTFTAWTEKRNQSVTAEVNNRTENTNVIIIFGASQSVLPWGKNLPVDDTDGCIIGESLAYALFGGKNVEGQKIFYGDRLFYVRGVVKEPDNIFLCQFSDDSQTENAVQSAMGQTQQNGEENQYERISFFWNDRTKTRTQTAINFMNKYGINGQMLHYEHRKNLNYLTDLIPGKWSDFSAWKENLKALQQQEKLLEQCEKSEIESLYLQWIQKRNRSVWLFGVSLLGCFLQFFIGAGKAELVQYFKVA